VCVRTLMNMSNKVHEPEYSLAGRYILGFSVTSSQCFIRCLSCFAHVVGSKILNPVYY
jgi:hypothetical protein